MGLQMGYGCRVLMPVGIMPDGLAFHANPYKKSLVDLVGYNPLTSSQVPSQESLSVNSKNFVLTNILSCHIVVYWAIAACRVTICQLAKV